MHENGGKREGRRKWEEKERVWAGLLEWTREEKMEEVGGCSRVGRDERMR